MGIKPTIQGAFIYATLLGFVATLAASRFPKVRKTLWGLSFAVALASVVWRGLCSGHAPMQNLFEFFLCMAAALWPLSRLDKKLGGLDTTAIDAAIGIVILFPSGFVFDESIRMLPPALQSPFFIPHVGSYVAAYILLARAAILSCRDGAEDAIVRNVKVGFLLLTMGLLLGSSWGQMCWGRYWAWDPKEMWSLGTWFVYAGWFHLYRKSGFSRPKLMRAVLWTGFAFIVLTLTWINLSRVFSGMHNYA